MRYDSIKSTCWITPTEKIQLKPDEKCGLSSLHIPSTSTFLSEKFNCWMLKSPSTDLDRFLYMKLTTRGFKKLLIFIFIFWYNDLVKWQHFCTGSDINFVTFMMMTSWLLLHIFHARVFCTLLDLTTTSQLECSMDYHCWAHLKIQK